MRSVTFLFTDIEDSTALWEQHPDAMQAALARHDALLVDTIVKHGGNVYKSTGDGTCASFDRPCDALAAAHDINEALRAEQWPTPIRLYVRIALGAGEAQWRQGDYYGPAVNLTARLLSLCRGGQTLLTVHGGAPLGDATIGMPIHRHGYYRLKGIDAPVEVAELTTGAPVSPPPPDSEKAYRVVRSGDLWHPLRDVRHNLAPERDAFVGRAADLGRLYEELDAGARMVTVLGPGGVGKTRLVRRYAVAWLGEWPGGVYFCDLSEARSLEGIHFAVALALGVPLGSSDASLQLGHAIAGRGRCLVILDNFEQVTAHAAATVGTWIDRAPQACFIVTSRESLHLGGEVTFTLEPLDSERDAMVLFEVRARAQRPGFALDEQNRPLVAQIVTLLDGLPLAIELAAARLRVLSPAQILERLKDRFALLAGARGVAARQGTLRAAIDWSWDLLSPDEQSALAQCATFDGGFTLQAAEAVLELPTSATSTLEVVQSLVDKSLLRVWSPRSATRFDIAEPYFAMYLSIHEYASEKLHALGDLVREAVEQRHGRYFATFGTQAAVRSLHTHGSVARRRGLALELDNLATACRRAILRKDPDTAASCYLAAWATLEAQGPSTLGMELGRQVDALQGIDACQRVFVKTALANALGMCREIVSAEAMQSEALEVARQAGELRAEGFALRQLAIDRHRSGNTGEAHGLFRAALAINERTGDLVERGALFANLANLQMEQGLMAEAMSSYQSALTLHRQNGNRAAEGIGLGNLGTLQHELGELDQGRASYEAALAIHREAGSVLQEAITLTNLGILLAEQADYERAAAHYDASLAIQREVGNRRGMGVVLQSIGDLHLVRGELADARKVFDEALAIHREVGNRRFEGGTLCGIGELLLAERRFAEARAVLQSSEQLLRAIDDPLAVARVLCVKAHASIALGNAEDGRDGLAEAESIAARLGTRKESDLQRRIAALRDALR